MLYFITAYWSFIGYRHNANSKFLATLEPATSQSRGQYVYYYISGNCMFIYSGNTLIADNTDDDTFKQTLIAKILEVLSSGSDEECSICLDSLKEPVITRCAHLYCKPCIRSFIEQEVRSLMMGGKC